MILKKDYQHSASSANAFMDSPLYWLITKVFKFEDKPNSRMVMGSAAEAGAYHALIKPDREDTAIKRYVKTKFIKLGGSEEDAECSWAQTIALKFRDNLQEFGDLVSYQKEIITPGKKYGLKYPIRGFTDFEFKDLIIDTKATAWIRRSKAGKPLYHPKEADIRQQILYKDIYKKDTMLLYCSKDDVHTTDMVDRDHYLEPIIQIFKNIEHLNKICKTPMDAFKILPLNFENFRWKSGNAKEFTIKLMREA